MVKADKQGWIKHDGDCEPLSITTKQPIEIQGKNGYRDIRKGVDCTAWHSVAYYRLLCPKHELDSAQARIAELEDELDILKGTVRANLRHFGHHDVSDLGEAHINKLFEIVINETDKRATQAHAQGYNEGLEAAAREVKAAWLTCPYGSIADADVISDLCEYAETSIRALKKGG